MNCPRDNTVLTELSKNGLRFHVCNHCNGILISKDDVQELKKKDLKQIPKFQISKRKKVKIAEGTARSPVTGELMKVIDYGGVKIDLCTTSNHVWLDSGELEILYRKHLKYRKKSLGENSDLMKFLLIDTAVEAVFCTIGGLFTVLK